MIVKYLHIAILLLAFSGGSRPAQAQTAFDKLTQKFAAGQVFHAHFKHHYEDAYTGNEATKAGDIWIAKKEYKIESEDQRVAVDGEVSRVYDSKRNRVIISKYVPEEDDFAPSRILNGVDSTYTVESQKRQGPGYFITLGSDDPFASFQQVQITLDAQGIPTKIFVKDPADNLITTTFSGGSFINRTPGMFTLAYPKGAKLIDMR